MALREKQIEIELLFKKKLPLQWAVNFCIWIVDSVRS